MAEHNHYGHRARLRDRVAKEGLENFYEHQVLEYALSFVIPYKDTNDLAHNLIEKFGSLAGVFEASVSELVTVKGMGEVSATFLADFIKIYNRYERSKLNTKEEITSPTQAFDYFEGIFRGKLYEEIYLVALTPSSKIVQTKRISTGSVTEAKVQIRDITDTMTNLNVANIIVAHNHPNGLPEPSADDDKFTKALVTSLVINGSHLIDHLIISDYGYFSYRQSGYIDQYKRDVVNLLSHSTVAQPEAKYNTQKTYTRPIKLAKVK